MHIWLPSQHQFKLMFQLHSHSWEIDHHQLACLHLHFPNIRLIILLDHCLLGALLDGQAVHQLHNQVLHPWQLPPPSNISTVDMVIFCKPSYCTTKFYFYSTASCGTDFNISIIISASNISGSVPNFA
ncbi:hypothetical protein ACFX2C_028801 [Malus domestica]